MDCFFFFLPFLKISLVTVQERLMETWGDSASMERGGDVFHKTRLDIIDLLGTGDEPDCTLARNTKKYHPDSVMI